MSDRQQIYLDYNATTPCDERVIEAMLPFFRARYGNAASRHWAGHDAEIAVAKARESVADLVAATPSEIIWTSGATEANNLAIKGAASAARRSGLGRHLITQATEHRATLDPFERLGREEFDITVLPVDSEGRVSPGQVTAAIRPDTALISIMWANNETGTVQDMKSLVKAAKAAKENILFHSDATQAVGKVPDACVTVGLDLMSFTAHKIYGPKGCGALYVRRRRSPVRIEAIFDGGGHERGLRSGTLNVPGIVGFGAACEIAKAEGNSEQQRLAELRNELWNQLSFQVEEVYLNGCPSSRLPNTLSVSFTGANSESILMGCDEIAMSSGSACTSASIAPSHVLRAMGLPDARCFSSIRISLGRFTGRQDVIYAADRLKTIVHAIRLLVDS